MIAALVIFLALACPAAAVAAGRLIDRKKDL